jgi:hypothetical protein
MSCWGSETGSLAILLTILLPANPLASELQSELEEYAHNQVYHPQYKWIRIESYNILLVPTHTRIVISRLPRTTIRCRPQQSAVA